MTTEKKSNPLGGTKLVRCSPHVHGLIPNPFHGPGFQDHEYPKMWHFCTVCKELTRADHMVLGQFGTDALLWVCSLCDYIGRVNDDGTVQEDRGMTI